MSEEEKQAIEYLKTRLYGNEGCKYIDVAQEDLRIFINLIDRREKEIKNWKKYSEELEKEKLEISNKECELEFDIEKLQKENEELKIIKSAIQTLQINSMEDEKYIVISKSSFLDGSYKHLLDDYIPVQKVKDKIEELKEEKEYYYSREKIEELNDKIQVLQELLEQKEIK